MKNLLSIILMFGFMTCLAQTSERAIVTTIDINAPIDTVWTRWTTPAGLSRFFAAEPHIELQTLGRLDLYFNPTAPEGQRGSENNRVLAWQQNEMLSFTWDAPPLFPEIRKQRTVVIVRFTELPGKKTKVTLTHTAFGNGKDWDKVFGYFNNAWSDVVLPRLKHSCENPTVNLKSMPTELPPARKL